MLVDFSPTGQGRGVALFPMIKTRYRRVLTASALIGASVIGVWSGAGTAWADDAFVLSHIPNDKPTAQVYRVLAEAYRRIGITTRDEFLPHERSLRATNAGEIDGEVMRIAGIESEFPDLLRVPEVVYRFETFAFTTGLSFKVDGWESLRPYSLCIMRGVRVIEQGTEGMNRTFATTIDQLIEMLRRGRCQVATFGYSTWLEIDRLHAGPLRQLEPPVSSIPLYHYVNRRHEALIPRIAASLRQMRDDGTTAAITGADEQPIAEARRRNQLPPP